MSQDGTRRWNHEPDKRPRNHRRGAGALRRGCEIGHRPVPAEARTWEDIAPVSGMVHDHHHALLGLAVPLQGAVSWDGNKQIKEPFPA